MSEEVNPRWLVDVETNFVRRDLRMWPPQKRKFVNPLRSQNKMSLFCQLSAKKSRLRSHRAGPRFLRRNGYVCFAPNDAPLRTLRSTAVFFCPIVFPRPFVQPFSFLFRGFRWPTIGRAPPSSCPTPFRRSQPRYPLFPPPGPTATFFLQVPLHGCLLSLSAWFPEKPLPARVCRFPYECRLFPRPFFPLISNWFR